METESQQHEDHGPEVTITVNDKEKRIHRGHQTVVAIKLAGDIPLADDLVQVINKKPVPLPDDGAVTIKGGETFISHPKGSGSS
jgi:hypothetical protein